MPIIGKFPFFVPEAIILRGRIEELEKRNLERPPSWIDDMLSDYESMSGVKVSEESSLKFAAVWAAVKVLSESSAQIPYQIYRRVGPNKEIYKAHPCYNLIHDAPNSYTTKFVFIQALMANVLLWGNGYARIWKDSFERPIKLELIHPSQVSSILIEGSLFYRIGTEILADYEMIHVRWLSLDGITGKSPIQIHKDSIGLGLAAQGFGSTFFKNGANSEIVYKHPTSLRDEQYLRLQKVIMSRQSTIENAHKPILLEGGMDIQQLTIPPDQAQFIQTRAFQVTDVARIFGLPPHMVQDLEHATFSNIEELSIEFVKYSLMPCVIRLEQEFTKKLIWESEKPDIFIEGNADGLMRGDAKTRAEYYAKMWQVGTLSANEIRAKENENPIEGGDVYFVPVNYQTLERAQSDPGKSAPVVTKGEGT